MVDLSKEKLKLEYPCSWIYKLVVLQDHDISKTLDDILSLDFKLKASKISKKGKFKSYNLELIVEDEKQRLELYELLKAHKDIKMTI